MDLKINKDSTGIKYYDSLITNPIYYYWMQRKRWDIQTMDPEQFLAAGGYDDLDYVRATADSEKLDSAISASELPMVVLDRSMDNRTPRARGVHTALAAIEHGLSVIPVLVVYSANGEQRERILQMVRDGDSYQRVKFYSDHTDVPMTRNIYDQIQGSSLMTEDTVVFTKAALLEAAQRRPVNVKFYRNVQRINKHDPYVDKILNDIERHNNAGTEAQIRVLAKFASGDHGRWPNKN